MSTIDWIIIRVTKATIEYGIAPMFLTISLFSVTGDTTINISIKIHKIETTDEHMD